MITLQNYILEQEISDASVDDIALEQAVAEFEVAYAIFECYCKADTIMENCDTDLDSFGIFMEDEFSTKMGPDGVVEDDPDTYEGDSSNTGKPTFKDRMRSFKNKVKNSKAVAVGKSGLEAISKFFKGIINFIGNIIDRAKDVKLDKLAEKIKNKYPADAEFKYTIPWTDNTVEGTGNIYSLNSLEKFTKELAKIRKEDPLDEESLNMFITLMEGDPCIKNSANVKAGGPKHVFIKRDAFCRLLVEMNNDINAAYKSYATFKKEFDLKGIGDLAKNKPDDKEFKKKVKEVTALYKKIFKMFTTYHSNVVKLITDNVNAAIKYAEEQQKSGSAYEDEEGIGGATEVPGETEDSESKTESYEDDVDGNIAVMEADTDDSYDDNVDEITFDDIED